MTPFFKIILKQTAMKTST